MTIEQLKAAEMAAPFRPFVLHLADGRAMPVHHREFLLAVPSDRTILVCEPDNTLNIVELLLVTDVEFRSTRNGGDVEDTSQPRRLSAGDRERTVSPFFPRSRPQVPQIPLSTGWTGTLIVRSSPLSFCKIHT